MKRMRLMGLCLVAVFALSVASASAAQPVFYGVAEIGKTVGSVKISGTPGAAGTKPKTALLAEFECGGGLVKVKVTGSLIGSLSGAQGKTFEEGKFAASNKLTFGEAEGKQKYQSFLAGECGGNANDCGPE